MTEITLGADLVAVLTVAIPALTTMIIKWQKTNLSKKEAEAKCEKSKKLMKTLQDSVADGKITKEEMGAIAKAGADLL